MTRSERGRKARETGNQGEWQVRPIFGAWGWIPRKDDPDNGEDFCVELPSEDGCAIHRFLVQVKSSRGMKCARDGAWKIYIKGKALSRYRKSRLPVFLVGADVATNEYRWLDLTLLLGAERSNSVESSGRTFLLPLANRFDEHSRNGFDTAVAAAFRRHDDRFHTPAEALKYRAEQLQAKDPRFQVQANLIGGDITYELRAREPVSVKFHLSLEGKDKTALVEAIKYGLAAKINPTSAEITGSPLFADHATRTLTLSQEPQQLRLMLGYTCPDSDPAFVCAIEEEAEATRGTVGGSLSFTVPLVPFQVRVRFDVPARTASFTFNISTTQWVGRDVRTLPYFQGVHQLLRGAVEHRNLSFAGRHFGEPSPVTTIPVAEEDAYEKLCMACKLFNSIECLVIVCKWAGTPLLWREENFGDDELEVLVRMAELIDGRPCNVDVAHVGFHWDRAVQEPSLTSDAFTEFQMHVEQEVRVWGEHVASVPIVVHLSGYRLERDSAGYPCGLVAQAGCRATMATTPRPEFVPI